MRIAYVSSIFGYDEEYKRKTFARFKRAKTDVAKRHGHIFEVVETLELKQEIQNDCVDLILNGKSFFGQYDCAFIYHSNIDPNVQNYMKAVYDIAIARNFPVINGSFIDHSKHETFLFLKKNGIPTIPTYFVPNLPMFRSEVMTTLKELGDYPYIVKPDAMFGGFGVVKADSPTHLLSTLDLCSASNSSFVIQPFIKSAKGGPVEDARCYIIGGEPFVCIVRSSATSYLANVSQGGSVSIAMPDKEIKQICNRISKLFDNPPYLCVDFIKDENSYLVSELEFCGGFTAAPDEWAEKIILKLVQVLEVWIKKI